jgi:hypothetical protein
VQACIVSQPRWRALRRLESCSAGCWRAEDHRQRRAIRAVVAAQAIGDNSDDLNHAGLRRADRHFLVQNAFVNLIGPPARARGALQTFCQAESRIPSEAEADAADALCMPYA